MEGILKQSTAINITVLMIDSADHITGKTGLAAGLTIYATKAAGTPAAITPTVTELDATNCKGLYKLALTTAHTDTLGELQIHVTATGADPADYKWQVSARLIDDLAFPATSGRSMVVDASGLVDANAVKVGPTGAGTAQTARDIGASVLLSAGTGTGQLDFTSGVVKANLAQILGTALTETAGQIAAAFKQFFNIASPTSTMNTITTVTTTTTATNLTNAPTAGDFTATMKTSLNAATPASVVGAVGSVTAGVTVTTNNDKTGYGLSAAAVQAIWDALTSALTTVGSVGKRLADFITGDAYVRLGAPAGASVSADIAAVKTDTAAIKVQTDKFVFSTANQVDAKIVNCAAGGIVSGAHAAAELNAIADANLDRNMATGVDSGTNSTSVRTARQALRILRNKRSVAAGTLTVTKEDDATSSWTAAVTTTAGDPTSGIDPT